MLKSTLG